MADQQEQEDPGQVILSLFLKEVKRRLTEEAKDMKAADLEFVRKLLQDNSLTIASVRRGDFGDMARTVLEEFPFPNDDGAPNFQ